MKCKGAKVGETWDKIRLAYPAFSLDYKSIYNNIVIRCKVVAAPGFGFFYLKLETCNLKQK